MRTTSLLRPFFSIIILFVAIIAVSAQEVKREIHLKIVENGVVKKDTVYVSTSDASDMKHDAELRFFHDGGENGHGSERHVMIVEDGEKGDMNWEQKDGMRKEMKVIVHNGEGRPEGDVEEIWIAKPGKPCHTIIIHEGDCPGGPEMEKLKVVEISKDSNAPAQAGEKNVTVEKKVIKTENGEKVIEVTTTVDDQPKSKSSKKK
jgi:hypothetical protein